MKQTYNADNIFVTKNICNKAKTIHITGITSSLYINISTNANQSIPLAGQGRQLGQLLFICQSRGSHWATCFISSCGDACPSFRGYLT